MCDTNIDHVRSVCEQITANTITTLTLEGLRDMILNHESASLKTFLTKSDNEMKRQGVTGAAASSAYRVLTEEEKLDKVMDMASSNTFPLNELNATLRDIYQAAAASPAVSSPVDDDDVEEAEEPISMSIDEDEPWIPAVMPPMTADYSWFYTVFYRVNGAFKLYKAYTRVNPKDRFMDHKIRRFQEAHLRMVQFLDKLADQSNAAIGDEYAFASLYQKLGESHYDVDASMCKVTRTLHQIKRAPLDIIQEAHPDLYWLPEEISQSIRDKTIDTECLTCWIDGEWNPTGPTEPAFDTHTLFYGTVLVLNQIKEVIASEDRLPVRDALWAYYVSFADLFYYANRFDDYYLTAPIGSLHGRAGKLIQSGNASLWELYGTMDTRAFTAGDLPDFYHVLAAIPLWGEQHTPSYFIGKIYQKSLPFACQRRHLIKLVVKCIEDDPAFWRVFSKLFWVLLANLYPDELYCKEATMGMRDLLRAKQLTDSKELLISALTAKQPGFKNGPAERGANTGANGGPLVVFTVFRMHILYMASFNEQYVGQAKRCIDWDYFKQDVLKLADIIRVQSLFPDDPFAQARKQLSKTVKSPHSRVHRLRRRSMAICLMDQFNETLEKTILKDKQNFTNDFAKLLLITMPLNTDIVPDEIRVKFQETVIGTHLHHAQKDCFDTAAIFATVLDKTVDVTRAAVAFYKKLMDVKFKAKILNALLRIQPEERLTQRAFSMLTLAEYGGISHHCVTMLSELVKIYHEKAVPKEFKQRIDKISIPHFMVVCFYFNMVALLEKISFVPLDADTVRRTDHAMITKRHHLFPGQDIPDCIYNVSVALCCEKVCTLMGHGKHGDKKVAYDIEKQMFVCAHGKSMRAAANAAASKKKNQEDEDDAAAAADEDDEDEEDDDDMLKTGTNMTSILLGAQNDNDLDFDKSILSAVSFATDLTADASTMKGKGTKRSITMQERKAVRNERKAFSKIPCGQPVLTFSLRGRALIWGNTLENKTQIMFCPSCGALHVYSMLNFSGSESGMYRCNECARKELMHVEHRKCAYCQRTTAGQINEDTRLEVLCPLIDPTDPAFDPCLNPEGVLQNLYFCKTHFRIARRFVYVKGGVAKQDLWKLIKVTQDQRNLQYARGVYKK